ncbi:hypothetical protein C8Q79DRAFT_934002, partial [Trametes meyenii]
MLSQRTSLSRSTVLSVSNCSPSQLESARIFVTAQRGYHDEGMRMTNAPHTQQQVLGRALLKFPMEHCRAHVACTLGTSASHEVDTSALFLVRQVSAWGGGSIHNGGASDTGRGHLDTRLAARWWAYREKTQSPDTQHRVTGPQNVTAISTNHPPRSGTKHPSQAVPTSTNVEHPPTIPRARISTVRGPRRPVCCPAPRAGIHVRRSQGGGRFRSWAQPGHQQGPTGSQPDRPRALVGSGFVPGHTRRATDLAVRAHCTRAWCAQWPGATRH